MAGAHIEFLSVDQLKARREKLLHDAGMSYEELLDGQYTRSLNMAQYLVLDQIRGIDFLLEDYVDGYQCR
ncbi:MAG TPA: hypothetical protein K8V32_09625 [Enteractinococcus helveticum]|uniref:Uncharacterized protein n=1 Tax=Enteractinococcus helveticum TaxID=1837282 RepID=A0A921FNA2_9MICC|nr:hypothetical protein [Enteractinococcus helveticum]HJF15043.1 hypothetical protein [Enteractinococcus helveticum]